jgi:two-component system, NtrC family, response regulator HupR/HoxA
LLESELFGHVKGAFTGATKDKTGVFEAANNGTLFLDEVGEMSLGMQVKLLRVLQEGTFSAVGDTEVKQTNARIISATNQDLPKMIKAKTFRQDLFYRLNVINVNVPALRDRDGDLDLLTNHFLKHYDETGKKTITEDTRQVLNTYPWPGNVRQLENEIQRMILLSENDSICVTDINPIITSSLNSNTKFESKGALKESVEVFERQKIVDGLQRVDGNKSALAKEMGVSRSTLTLKMKKYGISS